MKRSTEKVFFFIKLNQPSVIETRAKFDCLCRCRNALIFHVNLSTELDGEDLVAFSAVDVEEPARFGIGVCLEGGQDGKVRRKLRWKDLGSWNAGHTPARNLMKKSLNVITQFSRTFNE